VAVVAFHSITSSVSASSVAGTSSQRAFAILKLINSSNFVGCVTGTLPAFLRSRHHLLERSAEGLQRRRTTQVT